MNPRNRNELWARVLLDELARSGVEVLTVSPGSRSSPLVLAASADDRFRILVQIDERSAGFFALGCGKATGRPAGVITTSGTAVANLFPAVVEAAQSEVPLLLLTADRPPRLRGADANQAIDQTHLFGRYVRAFHELSPEQVNGATLRHLRSVACRAVADAMGDPGGPVHLNLPFDKPLEPVAVPGDLPVDLAERAPEAMEGRGDGAPFTRIFPRRIGADPELLAALRRELAGARRPLLVAGPVPRPWEVGPVLAKFAADTGVPLLADPLSGARFTAPAPVGGYDLFLRDPVVRGTLEADLVIRVGGTPTSTALHGYLEGLNEARHLVVDGGGRWKDHLTLAHRYLPADPALLFAALQEDGSPDTPLTPVMESRWPRLWERAEGAARRVVRELDGGEPFEGWVAREVVSRTPPEGILFVSSSMPVRDVDTFAHPGGAGGVGPLVLGNRGASGIDGIVSAAAGVSLAGGKRVTALVGDLALLHDQNGLASLRDPGVKVTLVVVNNDGGGIFHLLPIRGYEPDFTRFFATPHGRAPERIAAVQDLPFRRLEAHGTPLSPPDLAGALDEASGGEGSVVVEVVTHREENRNRRSEAVERAVAAARAALGEQG